MKSLNGLNKWRKVRPERETDDAIQQIVANAKRLKQQIGVRNFRSLVSSPRINSEPSDDQVIQLIHVSSRKAFELVWNRPPRVEVSCRSPGSLTPLSLSLPARVGASSGTPFRRAFPTTEFRVDLLQFQSIIMENVE